MQIPIDEEVLDDVMSVLGKCSEKIKAYESMGFPDNAWTLPLDVKKNLKTLIENAKINGAKNAVNPDHLSDIGELAGKMVSSEENALIESHKDCFYHALNDKDFAQNAQTYLEYLIDWDIIRQGNPEKCGGDDVVVIPHEMLPVVVHAVMRAVYDTLNDSGANSYNENAKKVIRDQIHQSAVSRVETQLFRIFNKLR